MAPDVTEQTSSETAELQAHIARLEAALAARETAIADLRNQHALMQAVIDHLPYAIYWKDMDLVYRGCNRRFASDLGLSSVEEVIGRTDASLAWQAGEAAQFEAIDRRVLESQHQEYDDNETVIFPNGLQEWFETYKIPLQTADGTPIGLLATYTNISARKQAEATVQFQATLLKELSTPVIPVSDDVLVLPLVGAIDSYRAQQVLSIVLERLTETQARVVLLDITGVPVIDTQVAHTLIRTGQAVQLLGARLILTGIRPEIAQALVGLGVELTAMITYSTLQRGLAEVDRRTGAAPLGRPRS